MDNDRKIIKSPYYSPQDTEKYSELLRCVLQDLKTLNKDFEINGPASSSFLEKIIELSLLCAESLEKDLEEKYVKDSEEFHSKCISVLLEFIYFFLHVASRSAFMQLGQEKRNKLLDKLKPLIIDTTVDTLFKHWPKNLQDETRKEIYSNCNNAEIGYGSCEMLFLAEGDTTFFEKIKSGKKSKSVVGQLIDNLSQIIEGKINLNAIFDFQIKSIVFEILKDKEIDNLVLEISKEIKI